mmetsp:Transcript_69233/g.167456  ORF Transcript_69233/g.167456 Transcript_69233/m.167456 type:complete len:175 (-) Transcript_69233:238-762(-)
MASLISDKFPQGEAEVARKMAMLPRGSVLRPVPNAPEDWPVLQCANVFVLPGVPSFFANKLGTLATHFLDGAAPRLHRQLCISLSEMEIVAPLNAVVALPEHATVSFGSYPVDGSVDGYPVDGARTVITLEADGDAEPALLAALAALRAGLPEGIVLSESEEAMLPTSPNSRRA